MTYSSAISSDVLGFIFAVGSIPRVVNSGGNVSASTGLALSTSVSGIGRREVHGMPFSVGARGGVVNAIRESTGESATDSVDTEEAVAAICLQHFWHSKFLHGRNLMVLLRVQAQN